MWLGPGRSRCTGPYFGALSVRPGSQAGVPARGAVRAGAQGDPAYGELLSTRNKGPRSLVFWPSGRKCTNHPYASVGPSTTSPWARGKFYMDYSWRFAIAASDLRETPRVALFIFWLLTGCLFLSASASVSVRSISSLPTTHAYDPALPDP
jgi:hypothetical protein